MVRNFKNTSKFIMTTRSGRCSSSPYNVVHLLCATATINNFVFIYPAGVVIE